MFLISVVLKINSLRNSSRTRAHYVLISIGAKSIHKLELSDAKINSNSSRTRLISISAKTNSLGIKLRDCVYKFNLKILIRTSQPQFVSIQLTRPVRNVASIRCRNYVFQLEHNLQALRTGNITTNIALCFRACMQTLYFKHIKAQIDEDIFAPKGLLCRDVQKIMCVRSACGVRR